MREQGAQAPRHLRLQESPPDRGNHERAAEFGGGKGEACCSIFVELQRETWCARRGGKAARADCNASENDRGTATGESPLRGGGGWPVDIYKWG